MSVCGTRDGNGPLLPGGWGGLSEDEGQEASPRGEQSPVSIAQQAHRAGHGVAGAGGRGGRRGLWRVREGTKGGVLGACRVLVCRELGGWNDGEAASLQQGCGKQGAARGGGHKLPLFQSGPRGARRRTHTVHALPQRGGSHPAGRPGHVTPPTPAPSGGRERAHSSRSKCQARPCRWVPCFSASSDHLSGSPARSL